MDQMLGQYRLLEELGCGGMGKVFKAQHTVMGRTVAVKVLAQTFQADDRSRHWFEREVQALTQLHHPNIVLAYDANEVHGIRFLVMEYVEGNNLQSLVKKQGPLPLAHVCEIVFQSALALQYAHERGMVHRDIKPGNLLVPGGAMEEYSARLLDRQGDENEDLRPRTTMVKIVDFGLARLRNPVAGGTIHLERADHFVGTPDYASPEQCRDVHAVDIRSDIYSLGCTFYCALTGQPPFERASALEKLANHLLAHPTPVEQLRAEVPADVAAILRQMMAKDPGRRFQTPLALAQALRPWRTVVPAAPVPVSTRGRLTRSLACLHDRAPRTAVMPSTKVLSEQDDPAPGGDEEGDLRAPPNVASAEGPPTPSPGDQAVPTDMILLASVEDALRKSQVRDSLDTPSGFVPIEELAANTPAPSVALVVMPDESLIAANWRSWSDIVTSFASGHGRGSWDNRLYRQLQEGLVAACRCGASAAVPARQNLYRQLAAMVEPWIDLESLERTEPEILRSLESRCMQAEQALGIRRPLRQLGQRLGQWTAPLLVFLLLALGGVGCRLLWVATAGGTRRPNWSALFDKRTPTTPAGLSGR
jgi:serine/threonine-protein kinase